VYITQAVPPSLLPFEEGEEQPEPNPHQPAHPASSSVHHRFHQRSARLPPLLVHAAQPSTSLFMDPCAAHSDVAESRGVQEISSRAALAQEAAGGLLPEEMGGATLAISCSEEVA
jgi:hypothetical protein